MIYIQSLLKLEQSKKERPAFFEFVDDGFHEQQNDCWKLSNRRLRDLGHPVHYFGTETCDEVIYNNYQQFPTEVLAVDPRCWSIGKLYAASIQTQEFLHVDMDVFISQPPASAAFVVQSEEHYYESKAWGWFYGFVSYLMRQGIKSDVLDEAWDQAHNSRGPVLWNFGVFGGSSLILPKVCSEVLSFCLEYNDIWGKLPAYIFVTCVLEQIIVPLLMQSRGVPPTPLLRNHCENIDAKRLGYCHLVGSSKHDPTNVAAVQRRLIELNSRQNFSLKIT